MKQTDMKKVRELLELHACQAMSCRQAAKIVGLGKTTAAEYIAGFKSSGLTIDEARLLGDTDLISALTGPDKRGQNERYAELLGRFAHIEKELARPGVTLHLLWRCWAAAKNAISKLSPANRKPIG